MDNKRRRNKSKLAALGLEPLAAKKAQSKVPKKKCRTEKGTQQTIRKSSRIEKMCSTKKHPQPIRRSSRVAKKFDKETSKLEEVKEFIEKMDAISIVVIV